MIVVGPQEAILTGVANRTYNAGLPYPVGSRAAAGLVMSKETLMSMTGSIASIRAMAWLLAIALLAVVVAGCQTSAGKGAAEGAGTGAIAGAVGGAVVALVFGGDPVEAAASPRAVPGAGEAGLEYRYHGRGRDEDAQRHDRVGECPRRVRSSARMCDVSTV